MTDEELSRRFDGIDRRFEVLEASIRDAAAATRTFVTDEGTATRAFIAEREAATRRHFDIVAEGLKADIQKIADGYDTLKNVDVTQVVRQNRLEERQARVEDRQLALEHRQHKLDA